jgi:hypothetical protein
VAEYICSGPADVEERESRWIVPSMPVARTCCSASEPMKRADVRPPGAATRCVRSGSVPVAPKRRSVESYAAVRKSLDAG